MSDDIDGFEERQRNDTSPSSKYPRGWTPVGGYSFPSKDDGKDDSHRFARGVFWGGVLSTALWLLLIAVVYAVMWACASIAWVSTTP